MAHCSHCLSCRHDTEQNSSINMCTMLQYYRNRMLSDSDFSNMNVIRELYINHNFADMTSYSKDEIDFILEYCCTS